MSDEVRHGGARRGAGRPAGSINRLPSKAAVFEARLIELVEPQYAQIVTNLITIALAGQTEANRLKATMYLLDRLLGKAPETLEIVGDVPATADALLDAWREAQK